MTLFAESAKLSGLLKSETTIDSYGASDIMSMVGDEKSVTDEKISARVMFYLPFENDISISAHYENRFAKGDSLSAYDALKGRTAYADKVRSDAPDDSSQLFSLTSRYIDNTGSEAYHRLDRFHASYEWKRSYLRVGRQAVKWGGSKIFSPTDIFRPYTPTDVVRDYKNGTDMVLFRSFSNRFEDVQFAVAPRRDGDSHDIKEKMSTAAVKVRSEKSDDRYDLIFGRHYGGNLLGGGYSGETEEVGYNADAVYVLDSGEDYFAYALTLDYSSLIFDSEIYSYLEFYYNSLGVDDIKKVPDSEELQGLINRGDVFLRDKYYAAGGFRYEPYSLIDVEASVIVNLNDLSYIFQPRCVWDIKKNVRILAGLDLPYGVVGSEFGGFYDDSSEKVVSSPKRAYAEVTLFF
jgi:hypothetical protein